MTRTFKTVLPVLPVSPNLEFKLLVQPESCKYNNNKKTRIGPSYCVLMTTPLSDCLDSLIGIRQILLLIY